MYKNFVRKLSRALFSTFLVKLIGFTREFTILHYFGISDFIASILALNFFPSIIATFLRYFIPNLYMGLYGEGTIGEKKAFQSAVSYVKFFYIILFSYLLYNYFSWSDQQIVFYLIYLIASIFIVISGVEEFRGLSYGKSTYVSLASLISNIICLLLLFFSKEKLGVYSLPLTILTQAITNYVILCISFDTIPLSHYFKNVSILSLKSNLRLLGSIVFIEIIGMTYNIVDYYYIMFHSNNVKLYQINSYALMFYNLPISVIGFSLITQITDIRKTNTILNLLNKYRLIILLALLFSFTASAFIFLNDNYLLVKLLTFFSGNSRNINSMADMLSIYITGVLPAIIVVFLSKSYILKNKINLVVSLFSFGLIFKIILLMLFMKLGFLDYLCVSLSTSIAWLVVSLMLVHMLKDLMSDYILFNSN